MRSAWPYRDLTRAEFDEVVRMLADGFSTKRGRRAALIHHDAVNHRAPRPARLAADCADFRRRHSRQRGLSRRARAGETFIGTVNEDFAVESMAGEIFQLGNASWKIIQIIAGVVRVEDAHGQPPGIPFWLGEAPARTEELSRAVSELREEVERKIQQMQEGKAFATTQRFGVQLSRSVSPDRRNSKQARGLVDRGNRTLRLRRATARRLLRRQLSKHSAPCPRRTRW